MAITKRSAASFIRGAPDGAAGAGFRKGRRRQITHTITDELMAAVDAAAGKTGLSRAAWINLQLSAAVKK